MPQSSDFNPKDGDNILFRNSATSLQTTRRHFPKSVILLLATVTTTNVTDTSLPLYLRTCLITLSTENYGRQQDSFLPDPF
jgi:hypothetical protein